jgi:cytidylate kinase
VIVAIDGPAGAGKSTVARKLAARLGIGYLNTGSMYRALTLLALRDGVDLDDEAALSALVRSHVIDLQATPAGDRVSLDGQDVTDAVREPAVTDAVSRVAVHRTVRAEIVAIQQGLLTSGDWVADGRDIGSVVCPSADLKVFLTASPEVRAGRRHAELVAGGGDLELGDVLQEITRRDAIDSTRAASPLMVAPGAVVLDSSELAIDEVVDQISVLVKGDGT